MPSDPKTFLYDIATAGAAIGEFSHGRVLRDYESDRMLRSACERQFEIIGEAMTRLRDRHPHVFQKLAQGPSIIAFRNRLIHGYDTVDSEIVWDVIETKLPQLVHVAQVLLRDET